MYSISKDGPFKNLSVLTRDISLNPKYTAFLRMEADNFKLWRNQPGVGSSIGIEGL